MSDPIILLGENKLFILQMCCPMRWPQPTCGSCALKMWLVQSELYCKCKIHTGIQTFMVFLIKRNVHYLNTFFYIEMILFWTYSVKQNAMSKLTYCLFLLFKVWLLENLKFCIWLPSWLPLSF